ncbi:class II fumarate hydratase [Desulfopila sp. IMCC35006]|uniref:class II fumarate hydratase n=1 Tax=Desulfopila sp. IMCC35006 TaxID=2569542 RepID=UPI0010ACFF9E|nr:class II fumarate hydratase [Desulfopila sp. IMCC35006]TKB27310.1 class II fumarate hydratase [Desulfopila sp. IMCC35006]
MKTTTYRIEKDSMGDVKVPLTALYGAQTQRAVENFTISSQPLPWSFIKAVLLIKSAAAAANGELGLLPAKEVQLICDAVNELERVKPIDQFPISIFQTGSATSTNMNVNEVIVGMVRRKGVELSANDQVNLSQSSNDVIPTALQVSAVCSATNSLLPALQDLAAIIRVFGAEHSDIIKTGRTHLMDALPIRLQAELEGWAAQIDECRERIESALPRLSRLPLGGTAVGSGVNCHPDFPAKAIAHINRITDLAFTQTPSRYKGMSSLDTVVEFSGHLKACAVALNKIANDLRWMNSGPLTGLGEIKLPALQPGSSIMPAKVNPVIPEAVCMATAQVIGNDTTINLAAMGGNFQLNTMLPLAANSILYSIELLTGSAASLGSKAIENMTVNRQVFAHALSLNPILVTSLNPVVGYLKAAEIGKIAQREGRTVLDVALEHTDIPRPQLERLLDPKRLADGGRDL